MESKTETDKKKIIRTKRKGVEEGWRNFQLISCTKIHFKFKPKTEMKGKIGLDPVAVVFSLLFLAVLA
jgi:hypothetical protein